MFSFKMLICYIFYPTIDIDYCIGATCFNGGVCRDGLTTYHCDCVAPYYGPNCKNRKLIYPQTFVQTSYFKG